MVRRLVALAVSAALAVQPEAAALAAAAEAPPPPATLDGVEVGPDRVTLHLSSQVQYNVFTTREPARLVLELLGTEHAVAARDHGGKGKYLKRVRSGQHQKEPVLIARAVLDLHKLVGYSSRWEGRKLTVQLMPVAGEEPEPPSKPAAPPRPAVAPAQPAAPAAPTAPAAPAAKAAATLDGIDVGLDRVTLRLSGQVQYNISTARDPARLVVELLNTEHAAAARDQAGKGRYIRRVRSGQHEKDSVRIARAVLELKQLVGYRSKWEGGNLIVEMAPVTPAEPETAAAPAAAAAAPAPAPAAEKPAAKPSAQPPAPPPPPPPAPKVEKDEEETEMPEGMTTDASGELEAIAKTADVAKAEAPPAAFSPGKAVALTGMRSRRDILGSLPMESVTLDFDSMDIRDVLKLLATKAKVNIIYGSDVSGAITLHLVDVPFNEAFTTILSMQGLTASQVGENILRVATPAAAAKEVGGALNQTRVIPMKYAKAIDVKAALDGVASAIGKKTSVVVDLERNQVLVTDTLEGIAWVERIVSQIDTRPQQVMIEAKLVEVTLGKDIHFGVQWDYLNVDQGKLGGQQGRNFFGTHESPVTATKFLKPLDNNSSAAAGIGAAGRGTGIFLPATKAFGAFTFGRVTNNYFLTATLTAAAGQGKVKVLSDPKVATLNGKRASINLTTSIPYVTSTVASTGVTSQSVSYAVTGIILSVTPTVNADGRITLEVNPSVSKPSATAASAAGGAPAVDSRDVKTTVIVQDGETIVIGGLITDTVSNTVAKVPILGDIPLLGWFFKKKSVVRDRVELLIFVTTKVLQS